MLQIIVRVRSLQNGSMKGGLGCGHDEHVGFVDGLPAADAGAVEAESFLEDVFFQRLGGDGEVLPQIRESP